MGVEFIFDERLKKAQGNLDEAIEILSRKENKDSAFLRRFWFACLKVAESYVSKEALMKKIEMVSRAEAKQRILPPPPKPVTKMVAVEEGSIV